MGWPAGSSRGGRRGGAASEAPRRPARRGDGPAAAAAAAAAAALLGGWGGLGGPAPAEGFGARARPRLYERPLLPGFLWEAQAAQQELRPAGPVAAREIGFTRLQAVGRPRLPGEVEAAPPEPDPEPLASTSGSGGDGAAGGTDGDAGGGAGGKGGEAGRVVTALVGSGAGTAAQVHLMDELALRVQEDKGVQKKSAKVKFGLVAVSPDRRPLMEFYDNCNGVRWNNNLGWGRGDPCKAGWFGVVCVGGRVTELLVNMNNVACYGKINFTSLAQVDFLSYVDLSENLIGGGIPDDVFEMKFLQ